MHVLEMEAMLELRKRLTNVLDEIYKTVGLDVTCEIVKHELSTLKLVQRIAKEKEVEDACSRKEMSS